MASAETPPRDFHHNPLRVGQVVAFATLSRKHGVLSEGYITGIKTIQVMDRVRTKDGWQYAPVPQTKIQIKQHRKWDMAEPWQSWMGRTLDWYTQWLIGPERMLIQSHVTQAMYINHEETLWAAYVQADHQEGKPR